MSSSGIVFGPSGQEWVYSQTTKAYNLSPKSSKTLAIPTSEGVEDTSIIVAPDKTALVIVDMQNFFLDAQCMEHPNGLKAVDPTIAAIEACRKSGIQILWLNWGLTDDDLLTIPAGVHKGFLRDVLQPTMHPIRSFTGLGSDLGGTKGRCLFAGSWNAAIYPPLAAHSLPSDIYCNKNRMSGIWNEKQPLHKALKEYGIETLLFGGVNTDQCVLGTFVDAYNKGWNCVLIDDCCGTPTVGGRETTIWNAARNYGFVVDSKGLKDAVEADSRA